MNVKDATGCLAPVVLLLQQYDPDIAYRPGRENSNADSLSIARRPYSTCELSLLKKEDSQVVKTRQMQRRDPELVQRND